MLFSQMSYAILNKTTFFYKYQYGFRKGFSCDNQLLEFTHDIHSNMDLNTQTDAIFLDFSKAFDRVPHCRLISKLSSLRIDDLTLSWIRNFLSLRQQFTTAGDFNSELADVTSGVPQGTVLGPLLFLIYINDLPQSLTSCVRLFADDCVLYRKINNPDDHLLLQSDIDRIVNWCHKWQMTLNTAKCKLVSFTRKRTNSDFAYSLNNSPIIAVSAYQYLGVELTSNLSWVSHINTITAKASRTLGYLKRNLKSAPSHLRKLSYETYVRPKLEYASAIWAPHQTYLINQIESIQNRAARFISSSYSRFDSVSLIKQNYSICLLETRRNISLLCLIHRLCHSPGGTWFSHLEPLNKESRNFNTKSFKRIFGTSLSFNNSSLPRAIKLWNDLPDAVVSVSDPTLFRSELTTYILTN